VAVNVGPANGFESVLAYVQPELVPGGHYLLPIASVLQIASILTEVTLRGSDAIVCAVRPCYDALSFNFALGGLQ
jgi:hypothetical protein